MKIGQTLEGLIKLIGETREAASEQGKELIDEEIQKILNGENIEKQNTSKHNMKDLAKDEKFLEVVLKESMERNRFDIQYDTEIFNAEVVMANEFIMPNFGCTLKTLKYTKYSCGFQGLICAKISRHQAENAFSAAP